MNAARIPLFPLNVVLFPGQSLPLHIFERRYREMTRHCINEKCSFGILYYHEGNLARIGSSALIVKTLKVYEDGRSDILTGGQRAFRVIRTHEERSYFEADVEYLEEDFAGIDAEVSAKLEQISFAYHVASELPLDVALRQELLELRSEAERQRRLLDRLTEWYPQLQNRERVRGKAAGNGRAKL